MRRVNTGLARYEQNSGQTGGGADVSDKLSGTEEAARRKGPRAGVGFWWRGSEPLPHQLGGLGSTVSSRAMSRAMMKLCINSKHGFQNVHCSGSDF